jgi:putative membrane protein
VAGVRLGQQPAGDLGRLARLQRRDHDAKFWVLAVAAVVFVLVNAIVRPIVILLALPAVILTLGIALIFVNAFMLWITDKIVPPFEVSGFWTYLGAAVLIWLVNMVVHGIFKPEKQQKPRFELTS